MSLIKRDDDMKASLFDDDWLDSDFGLGSMRRFGRGFFKSSLLEPEKSAASKALTRQQSWYDRELEAAKQDEDYSFSKSFQKSDDGADVKGKVEAQKTSFQSEDGRQKGQATSSSSDMSATYVSPDGKKMASSSSSSSSSAFSSKMESSTSDTGGFGSSSLKSSSGKSASFSSSSFSSASQHNSMLKDCDMLSGPSLFDGTSMLNGTSLLSGNSLLSGTSLLGGSLLDAPSSLLASRNAAPASSMSSSSMKSSSSSSTMKSSKLASESSLRGLSGFSGLSLGANSLFLAGDSNSRASPVSRGSPAPSTASVADSLMSPPTTAPPSYAESIADDDEDARVYYPISYKEVGRQNSVPVRQSFFTVDEGKEKKLKLQFYLGRGYDAKDISVKTEGHKLMVRCSREGAQHYSKDVILPEDIDENLISSTLSIDGVLTVQCLLPDSAPSASNHALTQLTQGPIVKDEEGNKIVQLKYDVKAFDPAQVKVVLQGNVVRIHAVKTEHSSTSCLKRELKREFALPADADKESLVYKVEDGILVVRVRINDAVYQRQLSEDGCVGNKIHLEFDVGNFEPEDVEVKVSGGTLKVAGRKKEKVEQEAKVLDFSRECVVPSWVDTDALRSYLTPGGKLAIEIPMEKTVRSELHVKVNQ